jgi:hypothetical protein
MELRRLRAVRALQVELLFDSHVDSLASERREEWGSPALD